MTLTKEEALRMIKAAQDNDGDPEVAHGEADDALCGFLEHLGHGDLVAEWHKVEKWYA
jgi:hypothetical protein